MAIPPFKGTQASREWVDYFRRLHQRPDVSIPADRQGATLGDHYRAYCERQRAKGEEPLPFTRWNTLRDIDPSVY
jgi:hypothetical protein